VKNAWSSSASAASQGVSKGETFLAQAVEASESDFLKVWIHFMGPEKILAWAAEKEPSIA
jgi:hypothetical protein